MHSYTWNDNIGEFCYTNMIVQIIELRELELQDMICPHCLICGYTAQMTLETEERRKSYDSID